MSVFTSITETQLSELLAGYDLGDLLDYQGISAGVENSNFFVNTDQQQMVLTIYEHHSEQELTFFTQLIEHLGLDGCPAPAPFHNKAGKLVEHIAGKPCAFFPKLKGQHIRDTNEDHCRQLGHVLAQLHISGQSFASRRTNDRGFDWCKQQAIVLNHHLNTDDQQLLDTEIEYLKSKQVIWNQLPQGIIHADLFHDNALFDNGTLSGLIDFYNACNDVLIYDLAICANDWCINSDGQLDQRRLSAMLAAYGEVRPLSAEEELSWNDMLRLAALRFWLSRLIASQGPSTELITEKDPEEFKNILLLRRQSTT